MRMVDDHACNSPIATHLRVKDNKQTLKEEKCALNMCRTLPSCHPDIYRRNFAAWCEECNAVLGNSVLAKQHRDTKKHKVNVTEYLVSEPAYFSYITSVLENDMQP
ncbi:MAG TPA: hypothetical protein VE692_01685 [Nitrososphaera sp.]|nr:hypothetical protein [Nitrososphaera sp.]